MEKEIYYSSDRRKVIIISSVGKMNEIMEYMDQLRYKYDNMLVIGNGFDLNLGLRTTYKDFVNSRIFKRVYVKRLQEKCKGDNPQPSLIDYLYGKKFLEKWYDIESALLEYVSRKPDGSFVNNVEEDKKDYERVCESLVEYLASLFKVKDQIGLANKMGKSAAGQLLLKMNSYNSILYSFNYTPIDLIIGAIYVPKDLNAKRVHGEIKKETIFEGNLHNNSIILGIETNDINSIAPGYSFLLKSNNPSYKSTNIASDLLDSKKVIFFGHSLNQMDFGYFEGYFRTLASNTDRNRMLTIITKDESSRITILDNIRKMGISVRDIFAHTNIQFVLTDKLYIDKNESEKYDKLFESL